ADSQYCDVAYRIPATPLATEPDGPHPELRHGGTVVRHRERDPLWGCDDIDHTWLPVRYDASDPSDASLDLPVGSGGKFLLIALGVLGMWHGVPKVWKRWRAWRRARRERRWQDVREKHHLGER
ncbi:MAG TPA: hypothetical protein VMJ10_16245, partial [Kofleriaceae bacterium]|nr:hypothetical protein [Kofleriaceae bacterium]